MTHWHAECRLYGRVRATLEFNLPEDQYDFDTAQNAGRYRRAVQNLLLHIRQRLKYESPSKAATKELEDMRTMIYEDLPGDLCE